MPLGDNYATLLDLKSRLGIGQSDTRDDGRCSAALATASRGIENCCNRQFNDAGSASARIYRPDDWYMSEVDDFHTQVGLVVKTDEADDGAYEVTWDTSDFQAEPLNGVVSGTPGWPYFRLVATESRYFSYLARHPCLQVTARWGWATVPDPVKEATLIVAEETFKLKDAPFGVAGFGEFGAVRVKQNPLAWGMVAPYRRDPVLVG